MLFYKAFRSACLVMILGASLAAFNIKSKQVDVSQSVSTGQHTAADTKPITMFAPLPPLVQKHFNQIAYGVTSEFKQPHSIDSGVLDRVKLLQDFARGYFANTTNYPPMYDSAYAAKVTRPYEQRLMIFLGSSRAPISQRLLTRSAMHICGNDKHLAALTLANFTKNIAAAQRGQLAVPSAPIDSKGYPYNTYAKPQTDAVFNRLERFDQGSNRLSDANANGSLYHFYGGIAATAYGLGFAVHVENAIYAWHREPIKREAGSLGHIVGERVFWARN
jgi:hypothetical protein